MQIAAVMDRLGDALKTISGLRVFPYYAPRITPPAALVGWPDTYEFDSTLARGADRLVLPVTVVVGKADERSARDLLTKYADGTGSSSVKQAIEQHNPASGAAWDSARVMTVEFHTVAIASVSYLAATFHTEVIGRGA